MRRTISRRNDKPWGVLAAAFIMALVLITGLQNVIDRAAAHTVAEHNFPKGG